MNVEEYAQRLTELLPQLFRGFSRYENNYFATGKISLPQLLVLWRLTKEDGCPMNELALYLGISKPATTGLIDRLISQKLVRREGDSKDRRIVRVRLTPKGRRIMDEIWEERRKMIIRAFGEIQPPDREKHLQILDHAIRILNELGERRAA